MVQKFALGAVGLLVLVGTVALIERCVEQRKIDGPGWAIRGLIARDGATTTVVVHDSLQKGARGSQQRIVAVDGVTGARLAKRTFRSGGCEMVATRGRVRCEIENKNVVLDVRTLAIVDEKVTSVYLEGGYSYSPRQCSVSSTVWLDGSTWGFKGREEQIFTRLPMDAEDPQHRARLFGGVLVERADRDGEPYRIDNDFVIQHRTSNAREAGYLLSRMTLGGVVRWTVPLSGPCSVIEVDADRVIVQTPGAVRALAIDARTGWVHWRLQFP